MNSSRTFQRFAITLNVAMGNELMDALNHSYIQWCQTMQIVPIAVPNAIADPVGYIRNLDVQGVILTGGNDIAGPKYNNSTSSQAPIRDNVERQIVTAALATNLPVVGICRGMQFLNMYFGGETETHITERQGKHLNHVATVHRICLLQPRIASLVGTSTCAVNSFHNHGVSFKGLAPTLNAFAVSDPDNLVEGFIHRKHRILGVQWHPERPGCDQNLNHRLFTAFLQGELE